MIETSLMGIDEGEQHLWMLPTIFQNFNLLNEINRNGKIFSLCCFMLGLFNCQSLHTNTNLYTRDQLPHKRPNCTKKSRSQFVDRFCVRVDTRIFRFSVYVNNWISSERMNWRPTFHHQKPTVSLLYLKRSVTQTVGFQQFQLLYCVQCNISPILNIIFHLQIYDWLSIKNKVW